MNFAQNLNIGSRLVIMSAFAFGLIEAVKQYDIGNYKDDDDVYSLLILSAFIVLFTLKSSLDDHKYFGEVFQDKLTSRYIGLILAFFSWIFFTIGTYFIYFPIRSAESLGISLLISTAWIAVHLYEITKDKDRRISEVTVSLVRQKWAFINCLYVIAIAAYSGWLSFMLEPYKWWLLAPLLLILLYDMCMSWSHYLSSTTEAPKESKDGNRISRN